MFFGLTNINYYDRMITNYIQEHCGKVEVPADCADNAYIGQQRLDEYLLMYAMHNIKIATCGIDTTRVNNPLLFIRNYSSETPDANCRIFFIKEQPDFIDNYFDGTEARFQTNEAVDAIVKQTEEALCKYEMDIKLRVGYLENNVIVMSSRTIERYRYSQLFLGFALLPMLFEDIKTQMTEVELKLCKQMIRFTQLSRKPKQDLLNAVRAVEEQEYIKTILLELNKEQYFLLLKNSITQGSKDRLEHAQNVFNNIKEQYITALENLKRYEREHFAAVNEDTTEVEEAIHTFLKHPCIKNIQRDNGKLYILVRTPLDIYDQDYVDCILNNLPDSNNFKKLWKALYEEDNGYFISSSYYVLRFADGDFGNRVQVLRDRPYTDDLARYKMGFNPHHFFFNCLGQFEVTLDKAVKENNYTVLGDLLATSTRSINLADTAVLNRFESYLNNNPQYYYVKYKDEEMTAQELLDRLEAEHEENTD